MNHGIFSVYEQDDRTEVYEWGILFYRTPSLIDKANCSWYDFRFNKPDKGIHEGVYKNIPIFILNDHNLVIHIALASEATIIKLWKEEYDRLCFML